MLNPGAHLFLRFQRSDSFPFKTTHCFHLCKYKLKNKTEFLEGQYHGINLKADC